MTNILSFKFDHESVRVVKIDGEPWFVGRDVAERLGYVKPIKAVIDNCKGVPKLYPLSTAGGIQNTRIIPLSDVLRLITSSRLPAAQKFERWVFEDVLPTIMRTGHYEATPEKFDVPKTFSEALLLAGNLAREKELLEIQVDEMSEDVKAHKLLTVADGSLNMTQAAKNLGIRPTQLIRWLSLNGWIYRRTGNKNWSAYQNRINSADLEHKVETILLDDGREKIISQVRVTASGLSKLAKATAGGLSKLAKALAADA